MAGRRKRRTHASATPGAAPFVERKRELSLLHGLLNKAKAGRGNLVVVSGEPGIGKTRLLERFCAEFGSRSVSALWGRCHPDPDVPAYWPWKRIIARHAERRDDSSLQSELGAAARDIVPLVPELTSRFPEFSRPPGHEPPETRQRFFDGMIDFLKRAALRQTLVLILDDLQWIDDASLTLTELVTNECRDTRLLLFAASRAGDFKNPQAEARVGALSRRGFQIELSGLDAAGVRNLIRGISGKSVAPRLAAALYETTQGNPLFVEQLTRFVAAHDAWNNVDLETLGLPRELKRTIQSRLTRFPERTRSLLVTAAAIGRSISLDVLANVADMKVAELLLVLHDALSAGILQEVPGSPRECAFAHALIRETLYDELPLLEKTRVHRRIARAILEARGPNLNDQLAAVAHHFFMAARGIDSEPAIDYCTRAGDHALDSFAYEAAVDHYRRALVVIGGRNEDQRRRCDLLIRLGKAQRYMGNAEAARMTFLEAIVIARTTSEPELFGRAALGFAGPWNAPLLLPEERVLALLSEAAERLRGSHPALRARVLARRVHEHWWSLTREQSRAELDEALELAETSGDPNAIAHVLHIRHLALWNHEDLNERLNTALRIVGLRDRIEQELVLEGYSWLMADELERGNLAAFDAHRVAHESLAGQLRLSEHIASAKIRRAARDLLGGRLREVSAACEQEATKEGSGYGTLWWAFMRFSLCREQHRVGEIEPLVRGMASAASAWPAMRYWLVCTLAAAETADARLEFDALAANQFSDLPTDLSRLTVLGFAVEACVTVGTKESAEHLYPQLLPFAGRHIQFGNGAAYFDSVSHMLARLATLLEHWDDAETRFVDALRQARALGAGPRSAHIQFHWAQLLIRRGRAEDGTRVRALLDAAVGAARHFELSGLVPKIEAQQNALELDQNRPAQREPLAAARPTPAASVPGSQPPASAAAHAGYAFRNEGEFWTLQFDKETVRLKTSRGLALIATLLRNPGTHLHALELVSGSESRIFRKSSAGSVIDAKARDAYRKRLQELNREQAEAEKQNDPPRAARARRESEMLAQQLARALGIGSRNRKAAAEAERARINVTRSIRSAIARMVEKSPGLAHHLNTSIRTGTFCHYVPDPSRKIEWEL